MQEQVKLLEANLFIGLVAFSIIASIAAFSVYAVLGTADIFGWLLLTLLIPVFGGRYVHRMAHSIRQLLVPIQ